MKPTLLPGQCFITRTAFDATDLRPGTVITFRHPNGTGEWVKRIVATADQSVQMSSGRLYINDNPVTVSRLDDFVEPFVPHGPTKALPRCYVPAQPGEDCTKHQWFETLGDQTFRTLDAGKSRFDDTQRVTVPTGHVFVLGDNRDNSIDSRLPLDANGIGLVPIANITGILDEVRP